MENASKALLMAAGVLIGIMILSLAVYLFYTFGGTSEKIHEQNAERQLQEFNNEFLKYDGREITIHDVITLANRAKENNKYYDVETKENNNFYIQVNFPSNSKLETKDNEIYQNLMGEDIKSLQESKQQLPTYKCKVQINSNTRRVYLITITK